MPNQSATSANVIPMKYLERLNRRLRRVFGLTEAEIALLEYDIADFLDDAAQTALNITNRIYLLPEMYSIIIKMAYQAFGIDQESLVVGAVEGDVASITIGGVSKSYGVAGAKTAILQAKLDDRITAMEELKQFRSIFRIRTEII